MNFTPNSNEAPEVEREMRDAIALHLEGLREAGQPIPEPSDFTTTYVDVAA